MLRFLGKSTASAARSGGSSPTEACGAADEALMAWELVNAAYSDEDDVYSYDSDETVTTVDDLELVPSDEDDEGGDSDVDKDSPAVRDFVSPCDIIAIQAMSVSPPMTFPVEMSLNCTAQDYCDDDEVDDSDEEDVDDDYDVDEELVPWKLKGRFVKQRITKMGIRKMGQRGGPKLKAKKLPYYDNRPGLSYGKLR